LGTGAGFTDSTGTTAVAGTYYFMITGAYGDGSPIRFAGKLALFR